MTNLLPHIAHPLLGFAPVPSTTAFINLLIIRQWVDLYSKPIHYTHSKMYIQINKNKTNISTSTWDGTTAMSSSDDTYGYFSWTLDSVLDCVGEVIRTVSLKSRGGTHLPLLGLLPEARRRCDGDDSRNSNHCSQTIWVLYDVNSLNLHALFYLWSCVSMQQCQHFSTFWLLVWQHKKHTLSGNKNTTYMTRISLLGYDFVTYYF